MRRSCMFVVILGFTNWMAGFDLAFAQGRVLGLDVSAWQGNISQATWNNIHNINDRDFVFIRSSRGGRTGYYNQSDPNNNNGQNTLSQRYDDHYFVQNINRATNAGMFAGPYHFSRPDIVASTQNSNGIANSGADEADHFIEMAGAWMRPGYLLPVHDLEAGDGFRSDNDMAQFALDFSNRVHEVMGVRPAIYINGNYANFVIGGASSSLRNQVVEAYPNLWSGLAESKQSRRHSCTDRPSQRFLRPHLWSLGRSAQSDASLEFLAVCKHGTIKQFQQRQQQPGPERGPGGNRVSQGQTGSCGLDVRFGRLVDDVVELE